MQMNQEIIDGVRAFMEQIPFNRLLGMKLETVETGFAKIVLPFREELIGDFTRGALHGGVVSTLIDTVGGACVWSGTELGDRLSTVDLRVDYLRPGRSIDLVGEGRLLRLGNRVGVADVVVYQDDPDAPIATGKAVYNVKRK